MKKTSRQKIVKKLDTIVSSIVRERGSCVQCGSSYQLTAGHVFSRKSYSTRWDLTNVFAQCWKCNFKHGIDPYPYWKWYRDTYGEKAFDELSDKAHKPSKFTTKQLEEMYEALKQQQEFGIYSKLKSTDLADLQAMEQETIE